MSLSLAIAANVVLAVGLVALLSYVMSSAGRLAPRRTARERAVLHAVPAAEQPAVHEHLATLERAA